MTGSTSTGIQVEHDAGVTTVVLAAPERQNAITFAAMQALIDGLEQAHRHGSVVLVVRAEGPDFTVGRDQSERVAGVSRLDSLGLILTANRLLRDFPGVTVSLVQGRALGFGSGLAVQSDLTIAADDAELGFDEVRHGLAPLVVADYLPELVGPRAAADLILTGRPVDADEAVRIGLVSRLVPAASLSAAGDAQVRDLLGLEPGALRLMKRYLGQRRRGELADPQREAIEQLDAWLTAGRPARP